MEAVRLLIHKHGSAEDRETLGAITMEAQDMKMLDRGESALYTSVQRVGRGSGLAGGLHE